MEVISPLKSKETISEEKAAEILDNLAKGCDELDMDAMEAGAEELKKYSFPEDKQSIIDDIVSAVEGFDTETALENIEKYRQSITG